VRQLIESLAEAQQWAKLLEHLRRDWRRIDEESLLL